LHQRGDLRTGVARPSSVDGGREDLKVIFRNESAAVTSRKAVKPMFKTNTFYLFILFIYLFIQIIILSCRFHCCVLKAME